MNLLRCTASALAVFFLGAAQAHDSWFEARSQPGASMTQLLLGTGNRFPARESSVGPGALVNHGCRSARRGADTRVQPLRIERDGAKGLQLRALVPAGQPTSCHAQMVSHELTLTDNRLVQAYFEEIQAAPALREAWADMQDRGLPWRERYTKHARIEFFGASPSQPQPAGMAMDLVLDAQDPSPKAGGAVAFTLLHQGQPLAGQPVELVSGQWRYSRWLRTDDQGRAQALVPLAGPWLLRSVHLRMSAADAQRWESDFVTLAFTVK